MFIGLLSRELFQVQIVMLKSRENKNGKLHFVINHRWEPIRIRTGCLVLRDIEGNCLMIDEHDIKSKPVIGFCGGTVEEDDIDIVETIVRETYEECILGDKAPPDWKNLWKDKYKQIQTVVTNLDDIIMQFIEKTLRTTPIMYLHGDKNQTLKCFYYMVTVPKLYSDYLVSKYKMRIMRKEIFEIINEMHKTSGRAYCVNFQFPSNRGLVWFRTREIAVSSASFVKFLAHGISYVKSETALDIITNSPYYNNCQFGQLVTETIKKIFKFTLLAEDKLELYTNSSLLSFVLLDQDRLQLLSDYWYSANKTDEGNNIILIVRNILHGTFIPIQLLHVRDTILDARQISANLGNLNLRTVAAKLYLDSLSSMDKKMESLEI